MRSSRTAGVGRSDRVYGWVVRCDYTHTTHSVYGWVYNSVFFRVNNATALSMASFIEVFKISFKCLFEPVERNCAGSDSDRF